MDKAFQQEVEAAGFALVPTLTYVDGPVHITIEPTSSDRVYRMWFQGYEWRFSINTHAHDGEQFYDVATIVRAFTRSYRARLGVFDPEDRDIAESDTWVCMACGNDSSNAGFHPCDVYGRRVEPCPDSWPCDLSICEACGLIVSQATGEIKERRFID